ncbi:MAG: hypothetical protein K2M11_06255 [Paramuribaculum sp.]|nr:hypothetical protein [Paramuribaculum sp.]
MNLKITVASGETVMISPVRAYSITAVNISPLTWVEQSLMISYHAVQKVKWVFIGV